MAVIGKLGMEEKRTTFVGIIRQEKRKGELEAILEPNRRKRIPGTGP